MLGIGDDNADGGLAAGEILGLADDVDGWAAQDLGDRLDALDGGEFGVVIVKAVAQAMPDDVLQRDGVFRRDDLLPGAFAARDADCGFRAAENMVLGVEQLGDEFARTFGGRVVRDGDREPAIRIGSFGRLGRRPAERPGHRDGDEHQRKGKQIVERGAMAWTHVGILLAAAGRVSTGNHV